MSLKPKTPKQWLRTSTQPQTQTLQRYAQFAAQHKQWQLLFRQIVGQPLADHCQLLNVREQILIVQTTAATWATQLKLKQGDIITHFQQDAMVEVSQMDIRIKPDSKASVYASSAKQSRRERLLDLAARSEEPLRSELLRLAEKIG